MFSPVTCPCAIQKKRRHTEGMLSESAAHIRTNCRDTSPIFGKKWEKNAKKLIFGGFWTPGWAQKTQNIPPKEADIPPIMLYYFETRHPARHFKEKKTLKKWPSWGENWDGVSSKKIFVFKTLKKVSGWGYSMVYFSYLAFKILFGRSISEFLAKNWHDGITGLGKENWNPYGFLS